MLLAVTLFLAAAAPAATPPGAAAAPVRGVQAMARATVEILSVASANAEARADEPRRQLRRTANGQTAVEFE